MKITGEMLIGATAVRGSDATLRAFDPARGADLEPVFGGGGAAEVGRACELAEAAFDPFRLASLETRAQFLEAIASNIVALGDELDRARAHRNGAAESAYRRGTRAHRGSVEGSSRRSCGKAAGRARRSIPPAGPQAPAAPRPAAAEYSRRPCRRVRGEQLPARILRCRRRHAPALAAGCPVVVKAHPAHLVLPNSSVAVIQKRSPKADCPRAGSR